VRVRPIDGPVVVRVEPRSARPSRATLARVDAIWDEETQRRARAPFNGRVFSLDRLEGTTLHGNFVDYKWLLAQLRDAALFDELRVRSLAVSGLLETPGGLVFGLRGESLAQDSRQWELVPSGAVEAELIEADPASACARQILAELEEEVGLAPDQVSAPRPFALVEDPESHVVDLGMHLETRLSDAELGRHFGARRNVEYEKLEIVPVAALEDFVTTHAGDLVTVSRVLVDQAKSFLTRAGAAPTSA